MRAYLAENETTLDEKQKRRLMVTVDKLEKNKGKRPEDMSIGMFFPCVSPQ